MLFEEILFLIHHFCSHSFDALKLGNLKANDSSLAFCCKISELIEILFALALLNHYSIESDNPLIVSDPFLFKFLFFDVEAASILVDSIHLLLRLLFWKPYLFLAFSAPESFFCCKSSIISALRDIRIAVLFAGLFSIN
jgi:hypothetical protein